MESLGISSKGDDNLTNYTTYIVAVVYQSIQKVGKGLIVVRVETQLIDPFYRL